jgi:hypothetical protein
MGCPPEDLDPQGAVAELLGSRSYADASNATAPMDVSRLALPPEGFTPVALEAMLSDSEFSDLVQGLRSKVLPKEAAEVRIRDAGLKSPYNDPQLKHNRKLYTSLLESLLSRNLLSFKRKVRAHVGLFTVKKKSLDLRLILDARIPNCWFDHPDDVRLCEIPTCLKRFQP